MEDNNNKDEIKNEENHNQENFINQEKNDKKKKEEIENNISLEPKYTINLGKKKEEKTNTESPKEKEKEKKKNNEIIKEKDNIKQEENKEEQKKDSNQDLMEKVQSAKNEHTKENVNLSIEKEKGKRRRRGKNEITDRKFKCPECDKSYLSGPALVIHRKTKHSFIKENESMRGRPKKDNLPDNSQYILFNKYKEFFNSETRKKNYEEENNDDNRINLDTIKDNLNQIFTHGKSKDLFPGIETVENYSFYQLLIKNWDKEKPEIGKESYFDDYKTEFFDISKKCDTPSLDDIFFLYLKEFSKTANKNYFLFMNKFIVLFREFINEIKRPGIKEEFKTENKKEYSELFCAECIPESCNDFFLDFMEPKDYFGLNNNELMELTQHFCFWLYQNNYSHSYLTLII